MKNKLIGLGTILPVVLVFDLISKRWALDELGGGRQLEVLGGLVPLTLAFNPGAAFGISIGSDPRLFFVPVTILALVLLGVLLWKAEANDRFRAVSLSLVISGALGNLYDRVRWGRGVVDFIGPINLGFTDFPIFNVADMAISCGAVMLAISFWQEEQAAEAAAQSGAALASSVGSAPEASSPSGHDPEALADT